jgi:hypothetical protein
MLHSSTQFNHCCVMCHMIYRLLAAARSAEPEVIGRRVYIPFTKCQVPVGETSPAEPWIFSSPDLLLVDDPNDATWELLPEGDVGIMPPDNR